MKTIIGVILATLTLAGCSRGPDATALEQELQNRLNSDFQQGLFKIASLRRSGTAPTRVGGEPGLLLYFNTEIEFLEDYDLSTWEGLNAGVLGRVLGANEKGILGIKPGGNKQGDVLRVHGRNTYTQDGDTWKAVAVAAKVTTAQAPELGNTAPRSKARVLLGEIESIVGRGRRGAESEIVEKELSVALRNINLRLDTLEGRITFATGEPAGEYYRVGRALEKVMSGKDITVRSYESAGSVKNSHLVENKVAQLAMIQNDIAAMAYTGQGVFSDTPPMKNLRALASIFPEPVQIVVRADSDIRTIADLAGKRVDIGLPESGSSVNALLIFEAHGIELSDLAAVSQMGLTASAAAMKEGTLDAFVVTLAAPAGKLDALAVDLPLRLVPLDQEATAMLARDDPSYVPVTLSANLYVGQVDPVHTVSVTAMLVAHKDASDEVITKILDGLFNNVDLISKVGFEASFIDRAKAKRGVTIPFHPSAEKYFSKS